MTTPALTKEIRAYLLDFDKRMSWKHGYQPSQEERRAYYIIRALLTKIASSKIEHNK